MVQHLAAPLGFAYLFERFPAFTQTFCIREVEALCAQGFEFPVFSIRTACSEPQNTLHCGRPVTYVPERFDDVLANDVQFRRSARKAQDLLRKLWGGDEQKRRIYEALWLGPRLQEAGVRHVHVHFAGTAARTAFWLRELFGIRYSVTAHANDIFCDEPHERLEQIFASAEVVVTVSDFSLNYLRTQFPSLSGKFLRVYNGIQTAGFPPSEFPPGPPLVVAVGRYIEKKGFSTLIDACARLDGDDWRCQIIGQGPLGEALEAQVREVGLSDRISITGPKTEDDIRAILTQARVFVLPCVGASDGAMDNLPTVIMEAMAAGLPVISTPIAAVPEMVLDERTGFLVPERDAEMLADRMSRLLKERDLAIQMGDSGRALCRELFEVAQTSGALSRILKDHDAITERAADHRNAA